MIVEALLRLLLAIHKQEPIKGNVLALGKQTIAISLPKILEIFKEQGCEVNPNAVELLKKQDAETRFRQKESITDEAFFNLFNDINYETMDVSDYEKASIIHNLNYSIPKGLEGKYDFIIDGGTFDHMVDIKTALSNVSRMLKVGGRLFQWNAASNYANSAYFSFGADFFHDYYVLNKFSNCRAFFAESYAMGAQNWCLHEFIPPETHEIYPMFRKSYYFCMVLAFAKKNKHSTYDKLPIQMHYRDEELFAEYDKNKKDFSGEKFVVQAPKFNKIFLPLKHKIFYKLHPKPDPKTYKYVGWI